MDIEELVQGFEARDVKLLEKLATVELNQKGLSEELADLGQKIARGGGGGGSEADNVSLGNSLVGSENFKSMIGHLHKGAAAQISVKATITSATANAAGSAGALLTPHRDEIVTPPRRRMTVRDLLPVIPVTGNSVEVPKLKTRTLNAGMVAEGTAKPQSDLQFEMVTVPIRTIAHWMKASRQILDDVPQLSGTIDGELLYGLQLKEEQQLLNGDGTGQNISGMVIAATAYAAPITLTSPTIIDMVGLAMLQAALADRPADGVIMHPSDWMRIRLLKNADGDYLFGNPGAVVEPRLFGVPVVPTQAMAIDKFLVGNFAAAATLYDRWTARVEVGFVDDDFTKNLITVLGEERIGLAVKDGSALVYGDFGLVA